MEPKGLHKQTKCKVCGQPFNKRPKPRYGNKLPKNIKAKNRVTCSRECSRQNQIDNVKRCHARHTLKNKKKEGL